MPTLENYLDLRNSSMGGGVLGGFQYFRGEQHVLLNREEFPCTDYTQLGSSFSQCVSQYLVNQVGCRVSSNTSQSSVVSIYPHNLLLHIAAEVGLLQGQIH